MRYLKYILVCFAFACSDDQKENGLVKNDSDTVQTSPASCKDISIARSNAHTNFLFSKTFIIPPLNYYVDSTIGRFYKDNENYIQVQESPGISFNSRKYFFSHKALDSMGTRITQHCHITVNGYEGFRITGPIDDIGDRKKTEIIFGNEQFTTLVYSRFNSVESEKEINNALQTIYYDGDLEIPLNNLAPFKVATEGSRFKFHSHLSNIYVYTIDGKGDPFNKDLFDPQFQVFETPYIGDTITIKDYFEKFLNSIERNGVQTLKITKQRSFTHNGKWAYHICKNTLFNGQQGLLHLFVTAGLKGNLVFLATTYKDLHIHDKGFEKIALSLQSK